MFLVVMMLAMLLAIPVMTLVVPNASKQQCLEMILKAGNMHLRLYTNNKVPALSDVAADYTEGSGSGYASIALASGSWAVTSANPAVGSYAQQTFTFSGAFGNAYGYYVTRDSDSKLMWAERFTTPPFVIASSADDIAITPVFNGA